MTENIPKKAGGNQDFRRQAHSYCMVTAKSPRHKGNSKLGVFVSWWLIEQSQAKENTTLEAMFRECMQNAFWPVRQIRIAMFNLERLDTQPTLWGKTDAERWGALDEVAVQLNE
jgi:hypothetical protein